MSSVAPGWYKDPAEPSTQRYWDGEGWIGASLPAEATPPDGPPPEDTPARHLPAEPTSPAAPQQPAATPGMQGWPPVAPFPPGTPFPPVVPPPPARPEPAGTTTPGAESAPPVSPAAPPWGAPPPGWPYPLYPYPPQLPIPRPHGLALAPLGARVVARLIDIGVVLLLNIVVNGWFVWRYVQEVLPVYQEMNRRALAGQPLLQDLPQPGEQAGNLQMVILLVAAALWFAYEVPALANNGQTLGKRLMGIRVVRLESGDRLGFGRSFRRWNTLGLPTLLWTCCGIGLVLQLVDCAYALFDRPLHQALHDKSARTVVVQVSRSNPTPVGPSHSGAGSDDRSPTPGGTA